MTDSPIRFLSEDGDPKTVPDGEMSGAGGLIQPARSDGAFLGSPESKGGHDLELGDTSTSAGIIGAVNDAAGVLRRAGMEVLSPSEAFTGLPDVPGVIADPHTGREMPDAKNKVGGDGSGELSALKP